MALTIDSQNPISITKDGVEKVYDKIVIPNAYVSVNRDKVALSVSFVWCKLTESGIECCPIGQKSFDIEDILTDADTAEISADFFNALITKAMMAGVIS